MESPLLYQNVKDKVAFQRTTGPSMFHDRIGALKDRMSFAETLCVLTECKEIDIKGLDERKEDYNLINTAEVWEVLIEAAINFESALEGAEWDGEWFECVEHYYKDQVRKHLFIQN